MILRACDVKYMNAVVAATAQAIFPAFFRLFAGPPGIFARYLRSPATVHLRFGLDHALGATEPAFAVADLPLGDAFISA